MPPGWALSNQRSPCCTVAPASPLASRRMRFFRPLYARPNASSGSSSPEPSPAQASLNFLARGVRDFHGDVGFGVGRGVGGGPSPLTVSKSQYSL